MPKSKTKEALTALRIGWGFAHEYQLIISLFITSIAPTGIRANTLPNSTCERVPEPEQLFKL